MKSLQKHRDHVQHVPVTLQGVKIWVSKTCREKIFHNCEFDEGGGAQGVTT